MKDTEHNYSGQRDYIVWERRDIASEFGAWSSWSRAMLLEIEAGVRCLGRDYVGRAV